MKPGDMVGARRWPYFSAHPDCWQPPWKGVVLAIEDPRAWAKTGAFPEKDPSPEAVKAHVAYCRANIPNSLKSVPVMWDFGPHGQHCFWEQPENLRRYADDYLTWISTREREVLRLAALRSDSQADLVVFRASRSASPAGDQVREHLGLGQ